MFRFDKPVPGNEIDPRIPDSLALNVSRNGPSLIECVNDLIPRSVILNPAMVLSKLNNDLFLVITSDLLEVMHWYPCHPYWSLQTFLRWGQ